MLHTSHDTGAHVRIDKKEVSTLDWWSFKVSRRGQNVSEVVVFLACALHTYGGLPLYRKEWASSV